jgi:serine/threonine protein kinase
LLTKMLQKKPGDRISAHDALSHPYFTGMSMDIECPESPKMKNSFTATTSLMPGCDSPLLTSANPKRRLDKTLKKDSCVDFKMGRDNVVTGKTD